MQHSSLGRNNYIVIFVDGHTPFEVGKFVKIDSDTITSLTIGCMIRQGLSVTWIRPDSGGEIERNLRRKLNQRSFNREHRSLDMSRNNGVAVRTLGLLREKAIAFLEELDDLAKKSRETL